LVPDPEMFLIILLITSINYEVDFKRLEIFLT